MEHHVCGRLIVNRSRCIIHCNKGTTEGDFKKVQLGLGSSKSQNQVADSGARIWCLKGAVSNMYVRVIKAHSSSKRFRHCENINS